MKIGILETGHVVETLKETHGDYYRMFSDLLDGYGFEFTNYAVVDHAFPESIYSEDGWIITGSRHGAYDELPWIPRLESFIRDAYRDDVPLLGICFGHQIVDQALGGKVEKFSGGWAIGPTDYKIDGVGEVSLLAMHQDQVVRAPEEAIVIGANTFCANAAFAYKGKALSYQPHPEFTPGFTADLIKVRAGKVFPSEVSEKALDKMGQSLDSDRIAEEMARFLLDNRKPQSKVA